MVEVRVVLHNPRSVLRKNNGEWEGGATHVETGVRLASSTVTVR